MEKQLKQLIKLQYQHLVLSLEVKPMATEYTDEKEREQDNELREKYHAIEKQITELSYEISEDLELIDGIENEEPGKQLFTEEDERKAVAEIIGKELTIEEYLIEREA